MGLYGLWSKLKRKIGKLRVVVVVTSIVKSVQLMSSYVRGGQNGEIQGYAVVFPVYVTLVRLGLRETER